MLVGMHAAVHAGMAGNRVAQLGAHTALVPEGVEKRHVFQALRLECIEEECQDRSHARLFLISTESSDLRSSPWVARRWMVLHRLCGGFRRTAARVHGLKFAAHANQDAKRP